MTVIITNKDHFAECLRDLAAHVHTAGLTLGEFVDDKGAVDGWREQWFRSKAPHADSVGVINRLVAKNEIHIAYLFHDHREAVRFRLKHGGEIHEISERAAPCITA